MPFEIILNELGSRSIRELATGAIDGIRKIDDFQTITEDRLNEESGNIIYGLINFAKRFAGGILSWLWEKAGNLLSWSLAEVWSAIVQSGQTLWNFDWAISDAELDAEVEAGWAALAGLAGGTLGNAVGWLVCGIAPSALMLSINESLGLYLLKEVGQEAFDEFAANLGNLVRLLFQQQSRYAATWYFKKIRSLLYPDKNFSKLEPWSFANQFEKFTESIDNNVLRQFVEEFFEELAEGCIEAGYVVANSISSFYMQQEMSPSPLGYDAAFEIKFNRSTPDFPDESGIRGTRLFYGKSELILPQIVGAIEDNNALKEIRSASEELPVNTLQRDKALIKIRFSAYKAEEIEKYNNRGWSTVSFRTKETIEDLTPALINQYANRIKNTFFKPTPFIWKKGKKEVIVNDPKRGFSARNYSCESKAEGRRLANALYEASLGINLDASRFKFSETEDEVDAYDETPPNETIAGRQVKGKVLRPVMEVRARYAQIIFGTYEVHTLIDATGKQPLGIYSIDI